MTRLFPRHAAPGGFTLIEVVVVIGLIGLLVALLIPAVQYGREAARRGECSNNLRQIGLAINGYVGVEGQLPQGTPIKTPESTESNRSVFVAVLPYLEAAPVFNAYNFLVLPGTLANLTAELARPSLFVCPSDAGTGPFTPGGPNSRYPSPDPPGGFWPMATSSYGVAFGTLVYNWQDSPDPTFDPYGEQNGSFNYQQQITLAGISDGLSNTAFASERAMGFINDNRVRPFGHWTGTIGSSTFLYAWNPPNSIFRDWTVPGFKASLMPGWLASSRHPGGVNVLFGDGSVRFVKDSIDSWPLDPATRGPAGNMIQWYGGYENVPRPGVWQAIFTRSGGEVVGNEF